MPKHPTNNALDTRRVFPLGFSTRSIEGLQFLYFTWRKSGTNITFTESIEIARHDADPWGTALVLRHMAEKIVARSEGQKSAK